MNPIDYEQARDQWATTTMFRGIMNTEWDLNNPDFMFCKIHSKSATILNPVLDGPSNKECQMCRPNELQIRVESNPDIEELQQQWMQAFDSVCEKSQDYVVQHRKALDELRAWLKYEKACWNIGIGLRQNFNSDQSIRKILQTKVQDTALRNHRNTNITYCYIHKQSGDAWPWRSTKDKYNAECGICIVKTQTQRAQYTTFDVDDDAKMN
jgi:hypothetical protein